MEPHKSAKACSGLEERRKKKKQKQKTRKKKRMYDSERIMSVKKVSNLNLKVEVLQV